MTDPVVTRRDSMRQAFEALALPHLPHLYTLAAGLVASGRDAEELVHEAYARGLTAFPTLRDPASIRGWLCRILGRLATQRHRRRSTEIAVGDLLAIDGFSLYDLIREEDTSLSSGNLLQDFLEQLPDHEVRAAVLRLPDVFRVPLVLLHVAGLSYRELADALGCPVGTVVSRLHRARKILEGELWVSARRRGLVRRASQ